MILETISFAACPAGPGHATDGVVYSINDQRHGTICTECGTILTQENHIFKAAVVIRAATCTQNGVSSQECRTCGFIKRIYPAALGHNYGEWVITDEANCTKAGTRVRTCLRCGSTQSVSEDALGHLVNTVWSYDDNHHWKVCTRCNEIVVAKEEHVDADSSRIL
jgi:RNase P subunit RPR2